MNQHNAAAEKDVLDNNTATIAPASTKLSDKVRARLQAFVEKSFKSTEIAAPKASNGLSDAPVPVMAPQISTLPMPQSLISPSPPVAASFLPGLFSHIDTHPQEIIQPPPGLGFNIRKDVDLGTLEKQSEMIVEDQGTSMDKPTQPLDTERTQTQDSNEVSDNEEMENDGELIEVDFQPAQQIHIPRSRSKSTQRQLGLSSSRNAMSSVSSYRIKSPHYINSEKMESIADIMDVQGADEVYDEDTLLQDIDRYYDEYQMKKDVYLEEDDEETKVRLKDGVILDSDALAAQRTVTDTSVDSSASLLTIPDKRTLQRATFSDLDALEPMTDIETLSMTSNPIYNGLSVFRTCNYDLIAATIRREIPCEVFVDVNQRDEYGMAPLHHVVRSMTSFGSDRTLGTSKKSHEAGLAISLLLEHGADLNLKDLQGITPIQYAALGKRAIALRAFAEYLRSRNTTEDDFEPPKEKVHIDVGIPSAATGHKNLIGLLCQGPRTAFDQPILEFILESEKNRAPEILNHQDEDGLTALRYVVSTLAVLPPNQKLLPLLASSARINIQYTHGMKILKTLIENNLSLLPTDQQGRTVLHDLAGMVEVSLPTLDLIFQHEELRQWDDEESGPSATSLALINSPDHQSDTPMHVACGAQNVLLAEKLLGMQGLDCTAKNSHGQTALHLACQYLEHPRMLKMLLLSNKFDTTAVDLSQNTMLHCVACSTTETPYKVKLVKEATKWLLAYGAKDAPNLHGTYAAWMGAQFDNAAFCEILLEFQPGLIAFPDNIKPC